jgi:hypothetical protein
MHHPTAYVTAAYGKCGTFAIQAQYSGPAASVLIQPPRFVNMATKEGRPEISDSEDESMPPSPVEEITDKRPANSSDLHRLTSRPRLQDVTRSHQTSAEHVPAVVSNHAQTPVVEQEAPAKNVETANTLPDNTPQQQHVKVKATSEKAASLKELQAPETSKNIKQSDQSDSGGQPPGQSMQQETVQGMALGAKGGYTPPGDNPKSTDPAMTQVEFAKQDQRNQSLTVGIGRTSLPTEYPLPEEQPRRLPFSVQGRTSAYTTMHEMSDFAQTKRPGPTAAPTPAPSSRKELVAEQPRQMDVELPDNELEQAPPDKCMRDAPFQDAETSNTSSKIQELEKNQLPQPQSESSAKAASGTDKPNPAKGSQEATVAELRAQKAALIASLAALSNIQELIAEIADEDHSSRGPYDGPTDAEVMTAADKIVKTHIKLLHEYNEIKDVGQGLMGLIADSRGVRIVEVQDEFGIDPKD